jgi:hypothetical protein
LTANEKAVLEIGETTTEGVNQRARAEEEQKEKGYMEVQHTENSQTSKILKNS